MTSPSKKDGTRVFGIAESRTVLVGRIAAIALVANLFFIGLAGLSLWKSKQRYEQAAWTSGQNLAFVLAEQIDETIEKVNLALMTVADEMQKEIASGGVNASALNTLIASQNAHLPVLDGLRATNAQGVILYGSDLKSCSGTSVSDRSYFIKSVNNPSAGMIISEPLICRVNAQWSLMLARRVNNPDGSFAGLVYGTVPLAYFDQYLASIDVGAHGMVSLRNEQLGVIARHPLVHQTPSKKIPPADMLKAIKTNYDAGHYTSVSYDKTVRLCSYRRTAKSNLYINVGLAPVDYLAAWRGEVSRLSVLMAVFILGTFTASTVVYRNATRRDDAVRTLGRQSRLQQLLMEISSTYINLPLAAVDLAVHDSLGELAEFVGVDRAHIFTYDSKRGVWTATHVWRATGGRSPDASHAALPELLEAGRRREPVYEPDVSALPPGKLREALELQGVKSLLAVPVIHEGQCIGLLEFDSLRGQHVYSGDEQRLLGVFAQMLANIWQRRRSEEKLVETNRHLARADAAKSEFLANMSHEIRTPMNGVLGMIDLLKNTELTEEQVQYTETARASGEVLLTVLNDILDFSKIEAGKLDLESVGFDLLNFIDDFVGIMAVRVRDKNLVLGCLTSPAVPRNILGDPVRLRQVLMNLTDNAIKFTARGEVIVRVEVDSETADDVLLRFTVHDTGIGIPSDKTNLLFTKFTQIDSSTTRQYGGTGLGLAICKQLVLLMGGDIGVRSEAGMGSEFWFTARLAKNPAAEAVDDFVVPELHGKRVLIVDGHPVNREILRICLQSWGMRPEEAADFPSARAMLSRAKAENDPFAVAILDGLMSDAEAKSFAESVTGDADLSSVRLVMLTSLGEAGSHKYWKGNGFAATLTKPLRRHDVRQVISEVILGRAATALTPGALSTYAPALVSRDSKILVVEDNSINRQLVVRILERLGLAADVAVNGVEAIRALETSPCDLVLMDVQMPEMDGFQATKIIRDPNSSVRNHEVPVIAMTAHAMQGNREECLQAGMNDYVSKPIKVPALVAVLEKWLNPAGNGSGDTKANGI